MIEIYLLLALVFLSCTLFYFALLSINRKEKYGLLEYDKKLINDDSFSKSGLININPTIDEDDIKFEEETKNKSMKYTHGKYVKNQKTRNTGNYSGKHIINT